MSRRATAGSRSDSSPASLRTWRIALVVVTVLAYLPALHAEFLPGWDDAPYVTENRHVRNGLTAEGVVWAWTTASEANYHPLTWLSLMLDASLWGLHPAGFHATNLLLHVMNVLLVLEVARWLTEDLSRGVAVAVLFALHPLHVESVAWISERKDVLSATFGLAALIAYRGYLKGARAAYAMMAAALAASLLSKATFVTLPCLLLVLDVLILDRFGKAASGPTPTEHRWRPLWDKLPLFGLCGVFSAATLMAQQAGGTVSDLETLPLSARLANAAWAYLEYLKHLVWPFELTMFYPMHPRDVLSRETLAALAGLSAITGLVVALRRRTALPLAGWLWYLGTLVPMIGLVQVGRQAFADRYAYVPMIGVYLGLATLVPPSAWWRSSAGRRIGPLVGLGALFLGGLTFRQCLFWHDIETLTKRQIALYPEVGTGYALLGAERLRTADHDEAQRLLEKAAQLDSGHADAVYNLGLVRVRRGDFAAALECFENAVTLAPEQTDFRLNLGATYSRLGRLDEAIQQYRTLLDQDPTDAKAWFNLGVAYHKGGRTEDAAECYRRSLELQSDHAQAREYLERTRAAAPSRTDRDERRVKIP